MVKLTKKLVLGRARASSLGAVKSLNCWGSGLTDISVMTKIHNVEVINASANSIESLRVFSHCCSLRELYLRKNKIESLNELLHLKDLSELRILWLSGNPCSENFSNEKYRLTVIKALPVISKLDNIAITKEEFERAKTEGDDLVKPELVSEESSMVAEECSKDKEKSSLEEPQQNGANEITSEKLDIESKNSSSDERLWEDIETSCTTTTETRASFALEETNELRKQLGLKPLPLQHSGIPTTSKNVTTTRQRTLGRSTASINVLTATLSLVKDLDEEALMTLQDAIQDRLHMIQRENGSISEENCDTTLSSNLSNEMRSPEKRDDASLEVV